MELAELQTSRRIVAIATDNMNQAYARLNQLARDLYYQVYLLNYPNYLFYASLALRL